jgi:hypothetical protein
MVHLKEILGKPELELFSSILMDLWLEALVLLRIFV